MYRFASSLASKDRIASSSTDQIGSRLSWSRNYAAKDIRFGAEARALMFKGVEELVDAVKVTMGPKGGNVVIEQSIDVAKVTRDGLAVAKSIEFTDRFMNVGASLVKQVANATDDKAGDGTTCAMVLTREIFSEACKSVASGANAMDLRLGMSMAVDSVVANLKSRAITVNSSNIEQFGPMLTNVDKEICGLFADAMLKVGKEGVITIQEGDTFFNSLELVNGMKLDRGYISPYFITNQKTNKCELEYPFILLHDEKISTQQGVAKVLELASKNQRPFLIVAKDVESEALATLIAKLHTGITVCAIKAPGFGNYIAPNLVDISVLTGGMVISESVGLKLENVELSMLGQCRKVTVSKDDAVIIDGLGDTDSIVGRCNQIRSEIKSSTSAYEKEKLKERLEKLSNGVCVLKIGGASEAEVNEKKGRVTDALKVCEAAIEEGILPGGGVALLYASKELDKLQPANTDQKTGVQIIRNALKAPVLTIATNAGVDGADVVRKLLEQDDTDIGYDAANGKYVNMLGAGIIDPLKVIRTALLNAVSASLLMMTTEAVVTELSRDLKDAPAMIPGPGMDMRLL